MIWLQVLSQIWFQYTQQQKKLEAVPEKMKGMSIQAGIYFAGLLFFLVLSLAAIILIFCDLGRQWTEGNGTHFSGYMCAAILMAALGGVVFGVLVLVARYLARKKEAEDQKELAVRAQAQGEKPPSDLRSPLVIFGEEFISQLLKNLKK